MRGGAYKILALPSQEYLRQHFSYCGSTGRLVWNKRPRSDFKSERAYMIRNALYANRPAGCIRPNGYIRIRINKKGYLAHRLIWARENGPIPDGLHIDHINGNLSDNRIENLRLVTVAENSKNRARPVTNKSGLAGAALNSSGRYTLNVCVNGRQHYLGTVSTFDEADYILTKFRRERGFSERHGR